MKTLTFAAAKKIIKSVADERNIWNQSSSFHRGGYCVLFDRWNNNRGHHVKLELTFIQSGAVLLACVGAVDTHTGRDYESNFMRGPELRAAIQVAAQTTGLSKKQANEVIAYLDALAA